MNYIAQADVEAYLGVTLTSNGQTQFAALLPRMQAMIDQLCNRTWNLTNPITENFDAYSQTNPPYFNDTYFVKYPTVTAIDSITIAGQPWDLNYAFNYGTHIKIYTRPQSLMLLNPLGYQAVQITYETNSAVSVPDPIKQALIEWIARKIRTSQDANKDINKVQAGTVNLEFKSDKLGAIPDFVNQVIKQYRLMPIDHF